VTDISATSFFRQAAADPQGIDFEHEEVDTGGTKRPTKIHLHAVEPSSGDRMGTLTYHVPRRKADKILIEHLGTEEAHQRKGVGSALMDEMQRRHPATPIDHGDRTDAGKAWWAGYTDGKKVTRGRTMATATATAAVQDGDDVPSRLLNPHGHHIRARVGNWTNVEMVPRHEVERYASQETDPEHAKAVGHHLAASGEMEPLMLHYHPASGEAYLGEGNHRLRAARALGMDHVPLRVSRSAYGLPGPGVKVPQDHPALAAGEHVPADIHPSHIGLTAVDKPTIPKADLDSARTEYHLTGHPRMATATKPCPCCGGTGEHDTGFECYHCDGSLTVPANSPDDATCDGRLPDGGHGKTASAGRPEWADGDFTSKTGHTYHTVTEPKAVTMRTPEGSMAGYVNWGDDGVIGNMNVRDEHQRRGIATELLRRAREQRPDLQHSDRLSDDAQAWLKGIGERTAFTTPVPDNHEPYQHEHDWLPRDHFFAPGEKGLDPRLFDENERMHPIVRQHLLSLLNSFWAPKYGDSWQSWARVYLAGSEASHFYGNGDLDILIGIDHDALNHHVDTFVGEPPAAVDEKLTDELRHGLNDDARMLPGPDGKETGPWENTWYVNPSSYDIRDIKPYAAYDITRDEWAVKPVEVPDDFSPEKLPESTWDVFEALQKLIGAVRELPDGVREREGAALYDYLHADRHSAFGPEGTGLYDPSNAVWKALDKAPDQPLQQLIDWKHAHAGVAAATDQEKAA
jgi:GNAT superfamily N-acetyltransferase